MTSAELHLADELRMARQGRASAEERARILEGKLEAAEKWARTLQGQIDEACRQNGELRASLSAEAGERAEAGAAADRLQAALRRIAGAEPHSMPADAHGHGVIDCPGCIRFQHWAQAATL